MLPTFALALLLVASPAAEAPAPGETPSTSLVDTLAETGFRLRSRVSGRWRWTPPRAHHACAVVVTHGSSKGSGVYVRVGDTFAVLTARHCLPSQGGAGVTVTWLDGRRDTSRVWWTDKTKADVGMIILRRPRRGVAPLPVCDRDPSPGERLEAMGFGGPENTLRAYAVPYEGDRNPGLSRGAAGAMHGDSGGGLLAPDSRGVLSVVSIVTNGEGASHESRGGRFYDGMLYPSAPVVRAFATRVARRESKQSQWFAPQRQDCPGGVCPDNGWGGRNAPPEDAPIYPPPEDRYRMDGDGGGFERSEDPRRDAIHAKVDRLYAMFATAEKWANRLSWLAGGGALGGMAWWLRRPKAIAGRLRDRVSDRFGGDEFPGGRLRPGSDEFSGGRLRPGSPAEGYEPDPYATHAAHAAESEAGSVSAWQAERPTGSRVASGDQSAFDQQHSAAQGGAYGHATPTYPPPRQPPARRHAAPPRR